MKKRCWYCGCKINHLRNGTSLCPNCGVLPENQKEIIQDKDDLNDFLSYVG